MTLLDLLKMLHLTGVIGLVGGLLVVQLGLPPGPPPRSALRVLNILMALGLLAGLAMLGLTHGLYLNSSRAGHYFGVVGLKLILLLAVGGLIPASAKRANGATLRWIALGLLLVAGLAAQTL